MALMKQEGSRELARISPTDTQEEARPASTWKLVMWSGYGILFLFFGVFGVWAAFAPLGSGAIATGKVEVAGSQRTVQHLEGGIIQEIRVQEGQRVIEGETLMVLDNTRTQSDFSRVEQQYMVALAREARLLAERDGRSKIDFPDFLLQHANEPDVVDVMEGQQRLFQNRRASIDSQLGLLDRRMAKSREEIVALTAQQRADRRQLDLINEEIQGVKDLVDKGLERKPRLLSLQRTEAQLLGSIDNRTALKARAEQTIAETEFQLLGLLEQTATEVESQLGDIQLELEDLRERMLTTQDALSRAEIVAPISGQVYGLRFHTIGGVIGPAEPILNLVPDNEELIVKIKVDTSDRDVVEVGAITSIRFTSFSQRTTKPIDGTLIQISADAISPDQGPPFYEGRVKVNQEMLIKNNLQLEPGMPAMAIISTGDQTLLDYLVSPISRSLDTALREK
jgi:HlyD family secretion protein/epimerase transport system membrane fusion protein